MRYLWLCLLVCLLSACTGADGERYVFVHEDAVQKAAQDGAFLMCLELTARQVGAVVPSSPENAISLLTYCANEVVSQYEVQPE